jgi:hypothetical protein
MRVIKGLHFAKFQPDFAFFLKVSKFVMKNKGSRYMYIYHGGRQMRKTVPVHSRRHVTMWKSKLSKATMSKNIETVDFISPLLTTPVQIWCPLHAFR